MANVIFGFPNRLDESKLSGGEWQMPVSTLLDRRLTRVARSKNISLESTQFVIEFNNKNDISAVALCAHTITTLGKWRITTSFDGDWSKPNYQTDWMPVWRRMYTPSMLWWESPNFWDGLMIEEHRKGYPALALHTFPVKMARFVKIEISDPTNQMGFIDIGRAFVGPIWTPTINASSGASIGWSTDTTIDKAIGGTEYPDVKRPRRIVNLVFNFLSHDEAMSKAFEMDRMAGVDKDVLFIFNEDDTINMTRNSFICRFQSLDPISYPYDQFRSKAYKLIETV